MAGHRRRGLLARRRRHDDEGEEDGSNAGDMLEYASTAGSLATDPEDDGEVSNVSADEVLARSSTPSPVLAKDSQERQELDFKPSADTEAMLNGLKIKDNEEVEELHFDTAEATPSKRSTGSRQQHPLLRSKSQPTESSKQQPSTQPFHQNRKGYFLHDDRTRDQARPPAFRSQGRALPPPNGRGFGLPTHDTNKQWTHDLHETVNQPESLRQVDVPQPVKSTMNAPNRSFSTTTVLGKVPVNISLPGVGAKRSATMVKKHYTLLPQHRPPLRRDKPVRISIPDEHPRYIFPSTERSFIFIPRAMRPNQQQFKGRGRGSFQGSRRTSVYSYTPSAGMSRRPSFAASNPGSGIQTPTGMYMPQQVGMQKPVVRMPAPSSTSFASATQNTEVFLGDNAAIVHSPPTTLPMHQPMPQKAISVADIESPTRAPQQQSQQPFHQQMPSNISDQPQSKMPHIPEGAIYAQPFQPYPNMPQPSYYGGSFHPGMMMSQDQIGYTMGVGGPVMPVQPQQQPQRQPHQQRTTPAPDQLQPPGPIAHESNGMVYYYDPSQQFVPAPMMNMGMMHAPYFYPNMQNQMFYQ